MKRPQMATGHGHASQRILSPVKAVLLGLLMVAATSQAQTSAPAQVSYAEITESPGFIAARLDVLHRRHAMEALRTGQYAAAAEQFRTAARYADKFSQAAYAEMLWEGRPGIAQDRPLAYAWVDLAAERGNNRMLLTKRERYWQALDAGERARALDIGKAVYAEYSDDLAQPRQERHMQRARRSGTGSRVGAAAGNVRVVPASHLGGMGREWTDALVAVPGIPGHLYYSDRYWLPENHWTQQDAELRRALTPRVRVGDLEDVEHARPDPGWD